MEREFPKNVKQIGNVCDEPKIYVEDYVDTYLNQLKEKAAAEPAAVILTGEILDMDGQEVVYIAGALKLPEIQIEGSEIKISDEVWQQLEEEKQVFFSGQDTVGWCLLISGQPMGLSRGIHKIHEKYFEKDNTVFVWRDPVEAEEIFYANKFGELMQMGGHYIFYEKNPSMQSYMINTRKKIGVTPSEMVEDRAAKDFRSTIREKLEYKEQKQSSKFVYAMSVMLVLIVLVIGVSTINNYDKMESVQNSLETLSQAVNQPAAQTETIDDNSEKIDEESETTEEVNLETDAENDTDIEGDTGVEGNMNIESDAEDDLNADSIFFDESDDGAEVNSDSAAEPENTDYYVVQKGDTLDGISRKIYGTTGYVDAICRMNGLTDGNLIIIGQKLLLP
ncbi:MAG: LysM peptidoglycan-binding domain-containing protein [Lachnospiraceae bacterium]